MYWTQVCAPPAAHFFVTAGFSGRGRASKQEEWLLYLQRLSHCSLPRVVLVSTRTGLSL